jgi:very-short-patch-repair endonuclease
MPLPGRGAIEGVVDGGYPDARLVIEADGRRWHSRVRDMRSDYARVAEAARVGWQTLRFLYEQIIGNPDEVCAVVRDVRAVRVGSRAQVLLPIGGS